MMYKISKIVLVMILLSIGFSSVFAQSESFGWANLDGQDYVGPVTGGGNLTPTKVTTFAELKSALESSSAKVIYVMNDMGAGYKGKTGDVLYVKSNKTVIGFKAGITVKCSWQIKGASNVIVRNLILRGPGNSNSLQNWDCVNIEGSKRIWFDHCTVMEGEDGNFDVVKGSDNVTASWCKFYYVTESGHNLSNLVGSSDGEGVSHGKLNVTYAYCWWDNVGSRCPRTRYGKIHVLNSYYNDCNDATKSGFMSNMRVEGCFFESNVKTPTGLISTGGQSGIFVIDCNRGKTETDGYNTVFTPPYKYDAYPNSEVKAMVTDPVCGAGATMSSPTDNCNGGTIEPNTNPVVSITSPTSGKSFDAPASVTLSATATDDGSIASVEFFNGSTSLKKVTSSPYTYTWSNVAKGSYSITSVATDNEGNKTTSSAVTFSVVAPKVPGIFVYSNTSGDLQYATGSNWDQGSTPSATDTAIIRSGEAQLKANVNEMIKIEPNGILRMVGFFTVPKVILQGGALQVNTSNTTYGLKAAVNVEKSSSIIAGANTVAIFNSEITFTGSKNLEKASGGTVVLKTSSPAYTGKWIVSEGVLSCAATHATGKGSISVKNGAILSSDVKGAIAGTDSLILESGSKVKVSAVDTVQYLITNGTSLKSGTYTASTLSQYLEGSGSLVVLKDGDSSTAVKNYVYDANVLKVYPNPIKDIGTVTYSVDNVSTIKVFDANGNIKAAKKVKGSGSFIFNEFGISMNGVYTVTISKNGLTYYERVFFTK